MKQNYPENCDLNHADFTPSSSHECYRGKNGFICSKTDFLWGSRTAAGCDLTLFHGYEKLWTNLFDDNMIEILVTTTNKKLDSYYLSTDE